MLCVIHGGKLRITTFTHGSDLLYAAIKTRAISVERSSYKSVFAAYNDGIRHRWWFSYQEHFFCCMLSTLYYQSDHVIIRGWVSALYLHLVRSESWDWLSVGDFCRDLTVA